MASTSGRATSVLFVLERLEAYRIPFYDALGSLPGIRVGVAHAGPRVSDSTPAPLAFRELELTSRDLLGLHTARVGSLLRAERWDVLVLMNNLRWPSSFWRTVAPRDAKVVLLGIGLSARSNLHPRPLLDRARWIMASEADAIAVYSEAVRQTYIAHGVAAEKVFALRNTIPVGLPQDVFPMKRNQFVFVGSLAPRKRLDLLIDAYASALPEIPARPRLLIVGSGPQRSDVEAMIRERGVVQDVDLVGPVVGDVALTRVIAGSLCSLSPGQAGLSVLTSLGNAVPFVTSPDAISGGEIENVDHGCTGLLVPMDVESYSAAMVDLANDLPLQRRLASRAQQHYWTNASPDGMVARMASAIEYAVGCG